MVEASLTYKPGDVVLRNWTRKRSVDSKTFRVAGANVLAIEKDETLS
jgi:hypothetical protein